jgi:hypothetical protein
MALVATCGTKSYTKGIGILKNLELRRKKKSKNQQIITKKYIINNFDFELQSN